MIIAASGANAQTFVLWGATTPTATVTSSDANDTICVGDPIIFTATIQAGCTYRFDVNGTIMQGPGGANTYIPAPAFTPGNQQVVVLVDNGTCSATDTLNFVTLGLPTPTLVVAPSNTICAGTNATFTGTGGTNYNFKVNNITVQNSASPTYSTTTLTNGQTVTVDVTNAGGCLTTSAGITMTVNALPVATLTIPDNSICAGTSATFTAGGGVNYNFEINGISMQNSALATFTTTALTDGQIVTVDVTNGSGCIATSAGITMTIYPLPTVATVTGNPTPACVSNMVNVDITGLTGTAPWSVEIWTDVFGNPGVLYYAVPGTVVISNPTILVPIPGVGFTTMHLRITDANTCSNF